MLINRSTIESGFEAFLMIFAYAIAAITDYRYNLGYPCRVTDSRVSSDDNFADGWGEGSPRMAATN